jgi:hypothetical protein
MEEDGSECGGIQKSKPAKPILIDVFLGPFAV